MANTYLTRTNTGTVTNNKIFTFSAWIKRSTISTTQNSIFASYPSGTSNDLLYMPTADTLGFWGTISGSQSVFYLTNRVLRDVSAWYHIVLAVDTTQATASDRVKIYINGVQETSFSQSSAPSQNTEFRLAKASNPQEIGSQNGGSTFDGLMSHVHFVDGTAYTPSAFGSTDSTTGEWKINTSPSITMGTNGFTILKDGNTITDQSSNSNNFAVGGGTLTNTEDCPSNVFATLNPLQQNNTATTYSNGNTKGTGTSSASNFSSTSATLAASSGKFYAEYKPNLSSTDSSISGFVNLDTANFNVTDFYGGSNNMSAGLFDSGGQILHSTGTNLGSVGALSNGDIVMLAMDLDNGFLYWGKNGTWFNSANPATSGGTGGLALSNLGSNGTYTFLNGNRKSMGTEWNFGNGFFGTTAISSEGTNASGIGKFEYDVPAGYTALSTKGLNE